MGLTAHPADVKKEVKVITVTGGELCIVLFFQLP